MAETGGWRCEKGGVSRRVTKPARTSRRSDTPMTSDSTVVSLHQPEAIDDPLTAILRSGARRLLAQAVEAEAEAFLAGMRGLRLPDGRERLVRHGLGPERQVQTGIGPVPVQRVKLRDRGAGPEGERIRFSSALLPRWARRTRSLDALLPVLYLRGVSMGDFQEALGALLGKEAPNLSPSAITRLRDTWQPSTTTLAFKKSVWVPICPACKQETLIDCRAILTVTSTTGSSHSSTRPGARPAAKWRRSMFVDCWAMADARASSLWPSGSGCPGTTSCTTSSAARPGMMRRCGTCWPKRLTGRSAARRPCWWSTIPPSPRRANSRSAWRRNTVARWARRRIARCWSR